MLLGMRRGGEDGWGALRINGSKAAPVVLGFVPNLRGNFCHLYTLNKVVSTNGHSLVSLV